ncbi:hypothetical protein ACIO3O_07100 [Streptomyces sp. NPDC087440]|uniref:hypothetical protein n=1 Tax=Streptomyces sp. NPDC087440 TaxID=3365790 RepID=UPI003814C78D
MSLGSDLESLLAEAALLDVDVDAAVADEHVRMAAYHCVIAVLVASTSRDRDRAVVATLLRDPREALAKTAVVALVDGVAAKGDGLTEFREWAGQLQPEIEGFRAEGHRTFIRRRIGDWDFLLSVEGGHAPTPAELAEVSDWMQRLLARDSTSPPVLALLAASARTRKVRNVARDRAGSRRLRAE